MLTTKVDIYLPAERVIRVPERLKAERELPGTTASYDNGPELISTKLAIGVESR